jgi:hypothetical protein
MSNKYINDAIKQARSINDPGGDVAPHFRPGLLCGGRPGVALAGAAFHFVNKHRHGLWPRSVMQFE